MNDTPRTNAMLTAILETHGHVGFLNCPPTWVAFARELERELNAANQRVTEREEYVTELKNRLRALWDKYDGERKHYMERIKRLEEAGDAIVGYNIGCGCGEDGPCRACRNAVEAWHKAKEDKP